VASGPSRPISRNILLVAGGGGNEKHPAAGQRREGVLAALWYHDDRSRAAGESGVTDPEVVLPLQHVGDLHEAEVRVGRVLLDHVVREDERAECLVDVGSLDEHLQPVRPA